LILVLGDNLPLLFVGWEGVGLCSYLLIGFWFEDLVNSAAGKKAFLMNRVGDFGFLLGMLLIARTLGGRVGGENLFSFTVMAHHMDLLAPVATAVCLLLFMGATGKSAQIPLFVWLPDAMAGPTPVSALIHAATMVTAGVYMVARMSFLFVAAPAAMAVVAIIGALTALVAATIALTQDDIKKVLAYSTVSQLGYMFLACGVGAFGAGIFHVLTHAFFKALLFLGAGSVITALHHEQDMRMMGGLRGKMPVTFITMAAATLAIAGVFPFAGFFSKDEILYRTFLSSKLLWLIGWAVAGLTAFYMMRLMALTFFGKLQNEGEHAHHVRESPPVMTIPLILLAVGSLAAGWIGWPHFLGGGNRFEAWLEPVFASAHGEAAVVHGSTTTEWTLTVVSLALALLGIVVGAVVYTKRLELADAARAAADGRIYWLLKGKYFVDEIYEALIVKPGYWISDTLFYRITDVGLIDGGLVNGPARVLGILGSVLRLLQNGMLRWYAYSFTFGALLILFYLIRHL
jgi:NADH-quinone oxidoreductase subunit L